MENLSLYQISSAFPILMENDEITEEEKKSIEAELTELLKQKSKSIVGYVRNMELTIESMKSEEKRISDCRKSLERKVESFKNYIDECMTNLNTNDIQTPIGNIKKAKNPLSIEITDIKKIPSKYITIKQEEVVDKNKIKEDFKNTGEIIDGVNYITEKTHIVIK